MKPTSIVSEGIMGGGMRQLQENGRALNMSTTQQKNRRK
jgi:hypothetical protein